MLCSPSILPALRAASGDSMVDADAGTAGASASASAPEVAGGNDTVGKEPKSSTPLVQGNNADIEALPSEAYSCGISPDHAHRARKRNAAISSDATKNVNKMLSEGADVQKKPQTVEEPESLIWRVIPHGAAFVQGSEEEESFSNLQCEALCYLTFQDAEGGEEMACTRAKTALASSVQDLCRSIDQLQHQGAGGNGAASFSLLESISSMLPSNIPVVSSLKFGHKTQKSTASAGSNKPSETEVFSNSEAASAHPDRQSTSTEKTMAELLAALRNKVNTDEFSVARGNEYRSARDGRSGTSHMDQVIQQQIESFNSFAGGEASCLKDVKGDTELTPEQKLKCLIQGYGAVEDPLLLQTFGEERYLDDRVGALITNVSIIGHFALTTHRLFFVAHIPSMQQQAMLDAHERGTQREALVAPGKSEQLLGHLIMKSGSAIQHRRLAGIPLPPRRVWLQLQAEGLFVFNSSESSALYRPLEVISFHDIVSVEPNYRPAQANILSLSLKNPDGTKGDLLEFEFGTRVGTLVWRREVRTALFRSQFSTKSIRLSVPLGQISRVLQYNVWNGALLDIDLPLEGQQKQISLAERRHGKVIALDKLSEIMTSVTAARINRLSLAFMGNPSGSSPFINHFKDTLRTIAHMQRAKGSIDPKYKTTILFESDPTLGQPHSFGVTAIENADPIPEVIAFAREFALDPKTVKAVYRVQDWNNTMPLSGTLCVSSDYVCFLREHHVGEDYRVRYPTTHLKNAEAGKKTLTSHTMILHIKGHEDVYYLLSSSKERDNAIENVNDAIEKVRKRVETAAQLTEEKPKALVSKGFQPTIPSHALVFAPKTINADNTFQPRVSPRRFCIPVIGSRGDVQPFIALGIALIKHHHSVRIVSHPEYEDWVRGHGIDFAGAGGDPGALMKLSVEHRLFSPAFFRDSVAKFRDWLDELLREVYEGCYDADVIIEAPQTMAGIHVAERLSVPYFRAFTMPWTRTTAYPQAFSVPPVDLGTHYNLMSYTVFDQVLWAASSGQINRWRKNMLGLRPTDLSQLNQSKVPFLYNFSSAVVPVPTDWSDNICVSGYWFLETQKTEWEPPESLVNFLEEGRKQHKKLAYCGFGSIVVEDPDKMTRNLYAAVEQAGVYAVIAKGWSSRGQGGDKKPTEIPIPKCCYVVDSIPHDWLFPQVDIALHHGGAGTTGASLRASLVTAIKPFFGDQFFWAQRVQKLGAGIRVASLSTHDLAFALKKAASDRIMAEKARQVGAGIQTEDGLKKAVMFLYANISRVRRQPRFRTDLRVLKEDKLVFYPEQDEVDDDSSDEHEHEDIEDIAKDLEADSSPSQSAARLHSQSGPSDHSTPSESAPASDAGSDAGASETESKASRSGVRKHSRRLIQKIGHKLTPSSDKNDGQTSSEPRECPTLVPRLSILTDLPTLEGIPKFSLTSAFKQMASNSSHDGEKNKETEEERKERERAAHSVACAHQQRARELLPRQVELSLAHRLAERMHNPHADVENFES